MTNYRDKDFIGFSFKGKHSFDMGIIRVSDGSRYDEDLLPTLQDKIIQVPGGDGAYYFGSYYTQRTFPIQIAFDSLTEKQFRELRLWLSDREPGDLIFDERPYKRYTAKASGSTSNLKYICFDEEGERIYKGEGTLNFICYYPFAKSIHKFLNLYNDENYPNKSQWDVSSYLKNEQGEYDIANIASQKITYKLYNAGDFETDFKLTISSAAFVNKPKLTISLNNKEKMELDFSKSVFPASIVIDTKNCSIYDELKPGNLYTSLLSKGEFFKIPVSADDITLTIESNIDIAGPGITASSDISYNYLYI